MPDTIVNGAAGGAYKVRVGSSSKLDVSSRVNDRIYYAARDNGKAFIVQFELTQASGGATEGVGYIKYDGNNIYGILFYRRDDLEMFKSKSGTKFPGDVFSGVFKSLRKLIDDRQVDGIHFNTDDNKLRSLYTKMEPLIVKRFPEFKLSKKIKKGNITEFLYLRKGGKDIKYETKTIHTK